MNDFLSSNLAETSEAIERHELGIADYTRRNLHVPTDATGSEGAADATETFFVRNAPEVAAVLVDVFDFRKMLRVHLAQSRDNFVELFRILESVDKRNDRIFGNVLDVELERASFNLGMVNFDVEFRHWKAGRASLSQYGYGIDFLR